MLVVPDKISSSFVADQHEEAVLGLLRAAGLRPTRQRVLLGRHLFGRVQRHVTAVDLHQEALSLGFTLSLATVYNTLNQFAAAGLLRKVGIEGMRT